MESINPATGQQIAAYAEHEPEQVDRILDQAVAAQRRWAALPLQRRAAALGRVGDLLERDADRLAAIVTAEMGKPLRAARDEALKCARTAHYYAEHAETLLAPRTVEMDDGEAYAQYRPLGVVLGVMPWNFPLWQAFRAALPILASGNGFVLKHAGNVTGCALAIEELVAEADLGEHVLQTVLLPGSRTSELAADPRIAAATLTGSEKAGSSLAATAGEHLKKTVLELGGNDAFIVLADADISAAAETGVTARFQNAGQSCIAAKRFIVVEEVADAFIAAFVAGAEQLVVGDPTQDGVDMGPLARVDLRDDVAAQVDATVEAGGRLLAGGRVPDGPGAFYPPTVVEVSDTSAPMMQEETFGPAAAILRVPDEAAAIAAANATSFGLSSSLWTTDLDRARELTGSIEAGGCFVNSMTQSDPRLPFGGIKRSGYGRELAWAGITEFVNLQTVRIAAG